MRWSHQYDDDEKQDALVLVSLCVCLGLKVLLYNSKTKVQYHWYQTRKEYSTCVKHVYHLSTIYCLPLEMAEIDYVLPSVGRSK